MDETGAKRQPQICRLCLAQTLAFFPLSEKCEATTMLEALTSLRILATDEISTIICLKCSLNLKLAFAIQQKFLKAEQRFREQRVPILIKVEAEDETIGSNAEEATQENDDVSVQEAATCASKDYPCASCGKSYSTIYNLYKHKYNVHRPQKCPICGKEIKKPCYKNHLAMHRKQEEKAQQPPKPPTSYPCDICGKVKTSQSALNQHRHYTHVQRKCPVCGKITSENNYKQHLNRHNKTFIVCELCGVSVYSQDLKKHIQRTHENHTYKCTQCEKEYKRKSHLKEHENKVHLKKADYVCDICGKFFYASDNLKVHVESTHLRLTRFTCEFCQAGFYSKALWVVHLRQHTNERPFKCDICGEGFIRKRSLNVHLKSQHKVVEKPVCECPTCGKKFASLFALRSHGRIH